MFGVISSTAAKKRRELRQAWKTLHIVAARVRARAFMGFSSISRVTLRARARIAQRLAHHQQWHRNSISAHRVLYLSINVGARRLLCRWRAAAATSSINLRHHR
jgi:hypothetical protein